MKVSFSRVDAIQSVALTIVGLILLSNIVVAILLNLVESKLLLASKELLLILGILFLILTLKITYFTLFSIAIFMGNLLVLLCYFFYSDAEGFVKLVSIRQFVVVFLIFTFGTLLANLNRDRFERSIIFFSVVCLLWGIVDRFFYVTSSGVLSKFFLLKSIPLSTIGYPYVFIEPIVAFNEFPGEVGFLRMFSVFLDPINFAHFLVASYVLYMRLGYRKLGYLFIVGVILCFSKTALLQLLLFIVVFQLPFNIVTKVVLGFLLSITALGLVSQHPGFWLHLDGLLVSIKNASIFGEGLGKAGNVAVMYGNGTSYEGLGDTFFGSLIGQLGVAGFLFYFSSILLIALPRCKKDLDFSFIYIVQVVLAFLSENAFNYLSIFYLVLLMGFYRNQTNLSDT